MDLTDKYSDLNQTLNKGQVHTKQQVRRQVMQIKNLKN